MTISGFRSFGEHFVSESKADNAGNHEVQKEANRGKFGEIQNIQDHKMLKWDNDTPKKSVKSMVCDSRRANM